MQTRKSETSLCRERLKQYCIGTGLDLGFGGDPITPQTITLDLPLPTTILGNSPQHLIGDARSLYWFKDGVLDYIYSSHLLEDFTEQELPLVLKEWFRVLKPGGLLILYCPNQKLYLINCLKTKSIPNAAHKKTDFGLTYIQQILLKHFQNQYRIVSAMEPVEIYSFELILKKTT